MAGADQRYSVSGRDNYHVGQTELDTTVDYGGTEMLSIARVGKTTRFTARVHYTRRDRSGTMPGHGSFVQIMAPTGDLRDRNDDDPDYLTVLNQPFAVVLDPATLRDILHLRGRVPFNFPSPMTGGSLHGYLQRGNVSQIGDRPAVAVRFDSAGPIAGPLPDHAAITIRGTMRMTGTAYYATHGALLLALDETMSIGGKITTHGNTMPVTIVYTRKMKADDTQRVFTEAKK